MTPYSSRIKKLCAWMRESNIDMTIIEDCERRRDAALRYFCGHPSDALLFVRSDGLTLLTPWDEILAEKTARADRIIPFTEFDRDPYQAASLIARLFELDANCRVEISSGEPYPSFLRYIDALSPLDVLCRDYGVDSAIKAFRSIKDESELTLLRRAAAITDDIIEGIERGLLGGSIKTEIDAALYIERQARAAGCEGTSFETLAAGPARSFGIHAFPGYTDQPLLGNGTAILDFGVSYEGYGSDVTVTIASGKLSARCEKQLRLVEKAYDAALEFYKPEIAVAAAAQKAEALFARNKRVMPHSLGHGVGLEPHEPPVIKSRGGEDAIFKAGMVVTLEPGLYADFGGCRKENDVLITDTGNEVLTHARIIRI